MVSEHLLLVFMFCFLIMMFSHMTCLFCLCLSPGRTVADYTSLKFLLSQVPYLSWLSVVVPSFLRLPRFALTLASNRF